MIAGSVSPKPSADLIGRGVSPKVLSASAFGEFHPLDDSEGPAAYRRNRRMELKLTHP